MGEVFEATIREMIKENESSLKSTQKSLSLLKNKSSDYANDHLKLIEVRSKISEILHAAKPSFKCVCNDPLIYSALSCKCLRCEGLLD